jgi:hypothetical protein
MTFQRAVHRAARPADPLFVQPARFPRSITGTPWRGHRRGRSLFLCDIHLQPRFHIGYQRLETLVRN